MNKTSLRKTSPRVSARQANLILGLALACGLFANNANAQMAVIDPASIAQAATNFGTTVEHYGKEVAQYAKEVSAFETQYTHYMQQLISLEHMDFLIPPMSNDFTEIDQTLGVDAECPSPTASSGIGSMIGGMLQMVTPDFNQPILVSQQKICQQIVMRRNDKYNLTVRELNRLKGYQTNITSLANQLGNVGTSQGMLAGTQSNQQLNSDALETEAKEFEAQITADDKVIQLLQYQQTLLAKKAMRGNNTILGTVVQATTLKAAFSVN